MYEDQPATLNPGGKAMQFYGPTQPSGDVVARQDTSHTEADFLRDLEKVTQRRDSQAS